MRLILSVLLVCALSSHAMAWYAPPPPPPVVNYVAPGSKPPTVWVHLGKIVIHPLFLIGVAMLIYDLTHPSAPGYPGGWWAGCADTTINDGKKYLDCEEWFKKQRALGYGL